jgi:hypothetical protein
MTTCKKCGKLFSPKPGSSLCTLCTDARDQEVQRVEEAVTRFDMTDPEEIAKFAGVSLKAANAILQETAVLERQAEDAKPCKRCRERKAQPDSAYCYDCKRLLSSAFDMAVTEMNEPEAADEPMQQQKGGEVRKSVHEMVSDRRGRSSRFGR